MRQVELSYLRCYRSPHAKLEISRWLLWIAIIVFWLAFAHPCAARNTSSSYSKLHVYGTEYPGACEPEELEMLYQELLSTSVVRPEQAWSAIYTVLCGPDDQRTRQFITKLVLQKVKQASEGTGQQPKNEMIRRSEEVVSSLIRAGNAWNVSIHSEAGKLILHYQPNEACMSGITLAYRRPEWKIVELGEACD